MQKPPNRKPAGKFAALRPSRSETRIGLVSRSTLKKRLLIGSTPTPYAELGAVRKRVSERQAAVGYTGDYKSWIEKVTPPDMA